MMLHGAQPMKFVFSPEQTQHLASLLPDFEAYVQQVNPMLAPHNNDVKTWKQEQLADIKDHPLFTGENKLPTEDITEYQWDAVCLNLAIVSAPSLTTVR